MARVDLAVFVAFIGYRVARASGSPHGRSIGYAVAVLVLALGIAIVKNVLGGH